MPQLSVMLRLVLVLNLLTVQLTLDYFSRILLRLFFHIVQAFRFSVKQQNVVKFARFVQNGNVIGNCFHGFFKFISRNSSRQKSEPFHLVVSVNRALPRGFFVGAHHGEFDRIALVFEISAGVQRHFSGSARSLNYEIIML